MLLSNCVNREPWKGFFQLEESYIGRAKNPYTCKRAHDLRVHTTMDTWKRREKGEKEIETSYQQSKAWSNSRMIQCENV